MKAMSKFWLGIFTFLPIVLMVVIFVFFFTAMFENIIEADRGYYDHDDFPVEFIHSMAWFVMVAVITGLISLGVRIFYIVHSVNNPDNDTGKRVMWIVILVFVGLIGSVVYYFAEILPKKPEKQLTE